MNKIIIVLLIISAVITESYGQSIDLTQMNRDLKIAEDIISTLFDNADQKYIQTTEPKATYVPGFGVMIAIGKSNHFYTSNFDRSFEFVWGDNGTVVIEDIHELEAQAEVLAEKAEALVRIQMEEIQQNLRELEESEEVRRKDSKDLSEKRRKNDKYDCDDTYEEFDEDDIQIRYTRPNAHPHEPVRGYDDEEIRQEILNTGQEVMLTYFSDYGYLINQLEEDEKITISYEVGSGLNHPNDNSNRSTTKLISTVSIKSLVDFRNGKMDEDDFYESIEFVEQEGVRKEPDLELISSIFQRLYKADLATTYYTSNRISYERMENFGVIFNMKVYSSSSTGSDSYKVITQNKYDLSKQERDKLVNAMYPQFEKELLQNILDYGRTIKCLEEDEMLIFQVALTECDGCEMPEQIRVSLNVSDLKSYDKGQMDGAEVMNKFKIKKD